MYYLPLFGPLPLFICGTSRICASMTKANCSSVVVSLSNVLAVGHAPMVQFIYPLHPLQPFLGISAFIKTNYAAHYGEFKKEEFIELKDGLR